MHYLINIYFNISVLSFSKHVIPQRKNRFKFKLDAIKITYKGTYSLIKIIVLCEPTDLI